MKPWGKVPEKGGTTTDWSQLDEGFVQRTYRSSAVIVGFTLFYLWVWRLNEALLPLFCGAALSLGLYWLNDVGIRLMVQPQADSNVESAAEKKDEQTRRLRKIRGIALVKYLLVGLLLWLATRFWSIREIAAFAGGFCLIHVGIVLRVISRMLLARMNETR